MKKVISFTVVFLLLLTFTACSNTESAELPTETNAITAKVVTNSGTTEYLTFKEIMEIESSNSVLFEREYIGADIEVTSQIVKIGGGFRLTSWFDCDAYVVLTAGSGGGFFKPITEDFAATLRAGDELTVSGKIGMATVTGSYVYILKDSISPY